MRVRDGVARSTQDGVVGVAVVLLLLERLVLWIVIGRGLVQEGIDRSGNEFDVPFSAVIEATSS